MLKEKQKQRIYLIVIAVVLIAAVVLVIIHFARKGADEPLPAVTPRPTQQVVVRERPVEKLVEIEKEVTIEEIRAGLSDMGVLLTEEYCFTDVVSFSSVKKLFNLELGITESSYLATYDGVVAAGVDFTAIRLSRDETQNRITVTVPKAQILYIDIDPQSFRLHSEKAGVGNPVSAADFNDSLVELEQTARQKALDRGILDKADENARRIIRTFVSGLVDTTQWIIVFEEA